MSSTTATKPTPSRNFFDLPRELRNLTYHHLWCSHPILLNSSARFVDSTVQLRFEGSYQLPERDDTDDDDENCPPGLFASKQLLREALDEYARNAEWLWYEDLPGMEQTWLSTQLDASKVQDMTVVFDYYPPVCTKCQDQRHLAERLGFDDLLIEVETASNKDKADGYGIRRLRFSGSTGTTTREDEHEHASLLAQRLWSIGKEADAALTEIGLWHADPEKVRYYEVVGEGLDVKATLTKADD